MLLFVISIALTIGISNATRPKEKNIFFIFYLFPYLLYSKVKDEKEEFLFSYFYAR